MTESLHNHRWLLAGGLLVVLTMLALPGFWPNGNLGISDWDYYFSYHEVIRRMVVEQEVFPHWNPYICGGTSGVGDPEFPLFAPTFLLELMFGVPIGLRLAVFVTTAAGAIGMLMLGKRLGLSVYAALLAAIAYGFGSVNLLEVIEGHPNVFSAAYVPWVLLAWYSAYQAKSDAQSPQPKSLQWTVLLAVLLALMLFQGGIYMLMYTTGAFIFFVIMARRRLDAFKVTAVAGLLALGLAALKLFPVAEWVTQFQDQAYASSVFTLPYLHEIFLGRHLHGIGSESVIPNQEGGWHEYGAYLGPVVMLLAAIGVARFRLSRTVRLLLLGGTIALLVSSTGPYLKPFFDAAPWFPRSNISRLILFTVIPLTLLAGYGLDTIRKVGVKKPTTVIVNYGVPFFTLLILGLAAYDLTTLSAALSQQAFVLPQPTELVSSAAYPLQHTLQDFKLRHEDGADYTRAYPYAASGYGTQSYCTVLGPTSAVMTIQHRDHDQSYVQIKDEAGSAELVSWSPHTLTVAVTATQEAEVIVNSNYVSGWMVNDRRATDVFNRLATRVPPGEHTLTFHYRAPGFYVGLFVTVITIVITLALLIPRKNKPRHGAGL